MTLLSDSVISTVIRNNIHEPIIIDFDAQKLKKGWIVIRKIATAFNCIMKV